MAEAAPSASATPSNAGRPSAPVRWAVGASGCSATTSPATWAPSRQGTTIVARRSASKTISPTVTANGHHGAWPVIGASQPAAAAATTANAARRSARDRGVRAGSGSGSRRGPERASLRDRHDRGAQERRRQAGHEHVGCELAGREAEAPHQHEVRGVALRHRDRDDVRDRDDAEEERRERSAVPARECADERDHQHDRAVERDDARQQGAERAGQGVEDERAVHVPSGRAAPRSSRRARSGRRARPASARP